MGRENPKHGYAVPEFPQKFSDFPSSILVYTLWPMRVPCRLSSELWERIAALAKAERRSGQAQLEVIVERGLEGLAAYELRLLGAERSAKLMSSKEVDPPA